MSLHLSIPEPPPDEVGSLGMSQAPPERDHQSELSEASPPNEWMRPRLQVVPPSVEVIDPARKFIEAVQRAQSLKHATVAEPAPLAEPIHGLAVWAPPLREAAVLTPPPAPAAASGPAVGRHVSRRSLSTPGAIAIAGLLAVSGLAFWAMLYGSWLSGVQEHRSQRVLYAQLREEFALQTSPISGHIKSGAPVGLLQIPQLGLKNVVFVEGSSSSILETGPGHRRDSPLPGEAGVSFILGRSQTFGGPFAHIDNLKPGDVISAETGEGSFKFTVDGVRHQGELQHLLPVGAARITLVTSQSGQDGKEAVFLDATSVGNAFAPSSGRSPSLPAAETYLKGDLGALGALVAWLVALIAAVLSLAWGLTRWGLRPSLVVGAPVLAALVWGMTNVGTRLLPNLV